MKGRKSPLLNHSLKPNYSGYALEAGCDEAGRGCLAGPVVAAAVILPIDYHHKFLNDSKQLTSRQRETIREDIVKDAVYWAIAETSNEEVDQINVLQASFLAMHRALDKLSVRPEFLIIDGHMFKAYQHIPHKCIISGDAKYLSIAAASILAKTYRDALMVNLAKDHPEYGWERNVGYPTKAHRLAIGEFGVTNFHRKTFRLTVGIPGLFD